MRLIKVQICSCLWLECCCYDDLWIEILYPLLILFLHPQVATSPKGQVEIVLELCDDSLDSTGNHLDSSKYDKNLNPFENDDQTSTTTKHRFSLSDMKLPNVKKLIKAKKEKSSTNGLYLKITTSKMRCSIKVKEEFENDAGGTHWLLNWNWNLCKLTFMTSFQPKFTSKQQYLNTRFSRTRGRVNHLHQLYRPDGTIRSQPLWYRWIMRIVWTMCL